MSINKIILLGHVSGSARVTTFENGGSVANFCLATNERGYITKDGREIPEQVEWHNIVVNKPYLVKFVGDYVQKGSMLYVEGKLKSRKYGNEQTGIHKVYEVIAETVELLQSPL